MYAFSNYLFNLEQLKLKIIRDGSFSTITLIKCN